MCYSETLFDGFQSCEVVKGSVCIRNSRQLNEEMFSSHSSI